MSDLHPGMGLVGEDGYVHATQRGIVGYRAVCGAGHVIINLEGEFDPDDRLACPKCAERQDEVDRGQLHT